MSNRTLIDEFITLIHSEANNNPPPKSCKIVKNYGDEPYSDVEVEDLGILIYRKTIGTTKIDSEGIICFLNGDLNQSIVITESITEIDLSEIYNALNDLDNSKSNIDHLHPQYLTEHQDLSNYTNRNELNSLLNTKVSFDELFNMIYPVGSIYMSVNDVNPAYLFGGTWEKIKGRFLIGADDTSKYPTESTGGEETHTLTVNEMPSHSHTQNAHNHHANADSSYNFVVVQKGVNLGLSSKRKMTSTSGSYTYMYSADSGGVGENANSASTTATNKNTGGGQAHNNIPPYMAVNIWKRIE